MSSAAPEVETEAVEATEAEEIEVVEELLVEEVSIDGMCGVY
jgi:mycofactocin precursor